MSLKKSEELYNKLQKVLSGTAWYGLPVYTIIGQVSFEAACEKPPGCVHNIAEIVLHMLSWTEEVMDRMNGMAAQQPSSGNWPGTGAPDEQKWQTYVNDLKLVNLNLLNVIQSFPDGQWNDLINDTRKGEPVTTFEDRIRRVNNPQLIKKNEDGDSFNVPSAQNIGRINKQSSACRRYAI